MPTYENNRDYSDDIFVCGNIKTSVKTIETLRSVGISCDYIDSTRQAAINCHALWFCLDGSELHLEELKNISTQYIIVHITTDIKRSKLAQIKAIQHLSSKITPIKIIYFAQNEHIQNSLKQYLPSHMIAADFLSLPVPLLPTIKVLSSQIQVGIYLNKNADHKLHALLSVLQESRSVIVRIWEDQPNLKNDFSNYPAAWSIYKPNTITFNKFANLCDHVLFYDTAPTDFFIEAAHQGSLICAIKEKVPKPISCLVNHDLKLNRFEAYLQSFNKDTQHSEKLSNQTNVQKLFGVQNFIKNLKHNFDLKKQTATQKAALEPRPKTAVLFISTNGIGLGHVTRLLAVASRCADDIQPVFAVFSAGVRLVKEAGYICEHLVSNEFSEASPAGWHDHTHVELSAIIRYYQPHAVIYDGNVLYTGVMRAISTANLPFLWSRRGLFKENAPIGPLHSQIYADILIEPGEFAHSYDKGPTKDTEAQFFWPRDYIKVPPVILINPKEALSRLDARDELDIPTQGKAVLIQVGAGNLQDTDRLIEQLVSILNQKIKANIYVAQWPISDRAPLPQPGLKCLSKYPMSKCLHAFDFVISATGYNSFHELMALAIPSILIPNEFTRLDDQTARARFAVDNGAALFARAEDNTSIENAIDQILEPNIHQSLSQHAKALDWEDGGQKIADLLHTIITGPKLS